MSLCDQISVLERINKNIIAEVLDNLHLKDKKIPESFLTQWKRFIFEDYFPFIFEIAEKAHFVNYRFIEKGVVPFNRFTSQDVIDDTIKRKKILVSLYKAPEWFAKTYHQLNNDEKEDSDLSDYLFICYNPIEDDGKKVTVSLHIMKRPKQVLEAELDYKKPFTKNTLIGTIFALSSIILSLSDFFHTSLTQVVSIGPLLLFLSFVFILSDVKDMAENILNGSINKLITKHKKSMRRRLNSTHSLVYLESFNRRLDASISITVLRILQANHEKMYFNDTSLLRLVQKNLKAPITSHELNHILSTLVNKGVIKIQEDLEIMILIEEAYLSNNHQLSQKLILDFDLPEDLEQELYDLYKKFRSMVMDICSIASLNPPQFPVC